MALTDEYLAELERLANGATALPYERRPRTKYSPYSIQDSRGYLFAEVDDGQNAELMVGASNALAALIAALRECRAERDKWDNANRDYWKERAEAAEAAETARDVMRRNLAVDHAEDCAACLGSGDCDCGLNLDGIARAVIKLRDERDAARAELAATKRAKAENDERFMTERDAARAEVEREHGVAKLLAEHAARLDDEVTRLRDIIRRCRESVERWVPRHEDDRALLAGHREGAGGEGMKRRDKPLAVHIGSGVMTIEIGVDTLAHACLLAPFAWEMTNSDGRTRPDEVFIVTDAVGFAEEVRGAMLAEREDGSSLLTDLLDRACESAVGDGSEYFEDVRKEVDRGE